MDEDEKVKLFNKGFLAGKECSKPSPETQEFIKETRDALVKRNVPVAIIAILGIILLEVYALHQGINGKILSLSFAAIAGLGGFQLGKVFKK